MARRKQTSIAGSGLSPLPSASCSALCPECGSNALYGPCSDYWGKMCVDCLHEIIPDEMKKAVDWNQNRVETDAVMKAILYTERTLVKTYAKGGRTVVEKTLIIEDNGTDDGGRTIAICPLKADAVAIAAAMGWKITRDETA